MENKTTTTQQEIDLATIMKSLAKQKGLIFIITLLCTLIVLAFQFSKLAFYAPKQLNYPIAIEFISENNIKYPNKMPFSASDIIAPVNLKEVMQELELDIDNNMKNLLSSLAVKNGNQLINLAKESLLEQINYNKKQPKEMLKPIKQTLSDLKRLSATYITLSLDIGKSHLTEQEGEQLLKKLVENWAKTAIDRGLINPDISYPHVPFRLDEESSVIDNYDYLSAYAGLMIESFDSFSTYSGAKSVTIEGHNINDLQRKLRNLITKDIHIMRAYSYAQSALMEDSEHLIEAGIFAQSRMLELRKNELEKKIKSYNELILSLNTNNQENPSKVNGMARTATPSPQLEQGVLNELLDLGSKVSTIDLKKELIEQQLKASEELFSIEKETAIILGSGEVDDTTPLPNRQKVIAILPRLLQRSVDKVNEIQDIFAQMIKQYSDMSLQKGITLYSPLGNPKLSNPFDIAMDKVILMTLIGAFLGLILGFIVALIRTL